MSYKIAARDSSGNRSGASSQASATLVPAYAQSLSFLSFDTLNVGASSTRAFTVSNTGTAALSVGSITSSSAMFTVSPVSLTLAAGAAGTLTVTFTPTAAGNQTGSLSIAHNASGSPAAVVLSGVATAPAIALSASALAFGNVSVGSSGIRAFTVSNTGTATLSVGSITASDALFTVSPPTLTVAAGAVGTLTVTFTPTSAGPKTGTLSLAHNAPGSPSTLQITGAGVSPLLVSRPDTLKFENVALGATVTLPVTLHNQGSDSLRVDSLRVSSGNVFTMAVPAPHLVIAPGDSQTLSVSFTPSAAGEISGSLIASTNDPDHASLSIPLTGTGVALTLSVDLNPAAGDQNQTTLGSVAPGEQVSVQLFVEDAPQIRGFTLRLTFDPGMLAFVPNSFVAGPLVPGLLALTNAQAGYVEVGGGALGGGSGSGSGLLGTLTFSVLQGFDTETDLSIPLVIWNRVSGGRQAIQADFQVTLEGAGGLPSPDFTGNKMVDFDDFFLFAAAFGTNDTLFDLDGDGTVGFTDFFLLAEAFGKPAP